MHLQPTSPTGNSVKRGILSRVWLAFVSSSDTRMPWAIWAFLLGFILLASAYSLVNPVFESPDEVYHYPYVKHVADGNGVPVQRIGEETLYEQEGSQPPLYYLVSAMLTRWIDTGDIEDIRRLNPHARIGVSLAQDNKNMVIHSDAERWPWTGTVLAVHLIRFVSVMLGAGTVLCTYLLANCVFPRDPLLVWTATALNALTPMFVFISGSVNNDNLIILLSSIVILQLVRAMQSGPTLARSVLIGVCVGLGMLSKLSGMALWPMALIGLFMARVRQSGALNALPGSHEASRSRVTVPGRDRTVLWRKAFGPWLADALLISVLSLAISGWWYARNWRLYGDPFGLGTMLDIFGRRTTTPSLPDLASEFLGFRISYWGLFGVVNVLMRPHWLYRVLDAFLVWSLVGLVRWVIQRLRAHDYTGFSELALLAIWVCAVSVSLLRWTTMTKASQGRLVYPAICGISVFLAKGALSWLDGRGRRYTALVVIGVVAVLAITAPIVAIAPAYARPEIITVGDIPASAQAYDVTYGDAARLVAVEIQPKVVEPGDDLEVVLYWEALAPIEEDWSIYIQAFGYGRQRLGQRDTYPGGGDYPTTMWSPGEVIRDRYLMRIRPDALGPVAADIEVGFYQLESMRRLPASSPAGDPVGRTVVGRVRVAGPGLVCDPGVRLNVVLAESVGLIGYDWDNDRVRAGDSASVTLYWESLAPLDRDYQVFLHLVTEDGRIIGQGDGPPLNDEYPTSYWVEGDTLVDEHTLQVAGDAPDAVGLLYVGMYHLETGERLPITAGAPNDGGNAILLTQVAVESN